MYAVTSGSSLCFTVRKERYRSPSLLSFQSSQIGVLLTKLSEQLQEKGKELNEFREKHNIRFRGEDDSKDGDEKSQDTGKAAGTQGVLVA